ncbi:MAG: glycosyltransferase family 2 protein [Christensenellales bacterium]|jgi:glycosyltransferase involved in cell wall biosynthesis
MNKHTPLVSLIIPVYNVAPYLARCLDSVAQQDYDNLEVLLIDDCSTDESLSLVQEYIKDKPLFTVFTHDRNKGLSGARNTGLNAAKGEYIVFLDSDDWVEKDYVSAMVQEALISGAEVVACGYDHVYDNGAVQSANPFGNLTTESNHRSKVALMRNHAVTRLYQLELFTRTGLQFAEEFMRAAEMATTIPLLSYANKIAIINRPLYHYYQRKSSRSNENTKKRSFEFINEVLSVMAQSFNKGFEKELEAHQIMEVLYSKVMLELTTSHSLRDIKNGIKSFVNQHPDWESNPYLAQFPSIKRRFILSSGRQQLLLIWALTKFRNFLLKAKIR